MRILDISVAAAYGILCLSLISVMNPYGFQHGSTQASQDADASSAAFAYVNSVGLPFLATASSTQICASMESWDNSTLTIGGSVDGHQCSSSPQEFVGSSSLELALSGRDVGIDAWVEAP